MKRYSKKNRKRYSKTKSRKRYSKTKSRKRYSNRTKPMKIKKNNKKKKRLTRLGKLWIKQMEIYMKLREVQ